MSAKPEKYITTRIKIEKLIPGGQAIGTMEDGKKALLWGTLPGEIISRVRVMRDKSTFLEGVADIIDQGAPERIAGFTDYYLSTSPWQIMSYDYELTAKREILQEIFRQQKVELGDLEIPAVATDGKDLYYRNKMEYALYYDRGDEKIYPAFRLRGTHRKLPVTESNLERPEIWQRTSEIINELNAQKADARRFQSLLLRTNQNGEVSGGLYENHQPRQQFASLTDEILGRKYTYSPNGFFQINLPVYEMVLQEIQKWITTEKVLDYYAGVGTIGLSVARDRDLTLVECDKSAYTELENNCRDAAATPILAKSEEATDYIRPDQTVIVDPPRAGCAPEFLEKILAVLPQTLIYLSCNPITQARDVAILADKYTLKHIQPYNFFPRTPHLENLIIMERK